LKKYFFNLIVTSPKDIGQIPIKHSIIITGGKSKRLNLMILMTKMEIVLRVLKGEKISDLVDEYDVSRNSIYIWKNEFLDVGMSKLSGDSLTEQEAKLKEKDEQIKEMEKIIGQQKVQMEILKKVLAELNTADKIRIINQLDSDYTITELYRTVSNF